VNARPLRTIAGLLALLLPFAGGGCGKSSSTGAGATPVNRDTPKAVAKTLFQAMYDGDRKTAAECITPGPGQADALEGSTVVTVGMRKATDAMVKRWGTKEVEKQLGPVDVTRIDPRLIDEGKETITGNTATIKTTKQTQTIQLAKGDDGWRVDLAKTLNLDEKMLTMAKPMFTAMGKAGEEVAAEVEAGKYNNMVEGVNALKARIQQSIQNEQKRMIDELKKSQPAPAR
jgi:hypothetical protein